MLHDENFSRLKQHYFKREEVFDRNDRTFQLNFTCKEKFFIGFSPKTTFNASGGADPAIK